MRRRIVGAGIGVALSLAIAGTVLAGSCSNISRPAPDCGLACNEPVIHGNWVWLPSVGEAEEAWGFEPPGTDESVEAGLPGQHGNYQNGFSESLLGHSAYCTKGVNTERTHGIVSGCE
jgi:hypothetical protein